MAQPIETKLSVNLNKVALLRNQRDVGYPSVLEAARLVIGAGAHGVTVHPRPDERHIRRSDVYELAALVAAEFGPRSSTISRATRAPTSSPWSAKSGPTR